MINRSRNQPSDPLDWVRRGEDPPGTVVKFVCNEIGKGLFAEKEFQKGEFLVEYAGQQKLPEEIETTADQTYIFHFRSGVSNMCIDATNSTRRGKYANDEWRRPNALVKQILLGQTPKLLIFAAKNISCGEEIRFDYGQKNASWRKKGATSTGIKQNDDSQEVTACDVDLTTSGPLCHDSSTGDVNRGRSEDADIIVGDVLKPTEPFPKESITADLLSRECENTEVTACDVDLTTSGSLCHDSSTGDVNRGRSEDADIIVGDVLKPTEPLPKESITADLLSRECENTDIIVGDVLKPTEPLPKESITADLLSRECENTGMTVGDIRLASGLVSPKVMNISESLGQCKDTESKKDETSGSADSDNDKEYNPEGAESGESEEEISSSDEETNDERVSDSEDSESIELPLRVRRLDIFNDNVVNETGSPEHTSSLDNTEDEDSDSGTEPDR